MRKYHQKPMPDTLLGTLMRCGVLQMSWVLFFLKKGQCHLLNFICHLEIVLIYSKYCVFKIVYDI